MKNAVQSNASIWQKEGWHPWQRLLFRFGFVYLFLYILPTYLSFFTNLASVEEINPLKSLVLWVGKTIFSIAYLPTAFNGSGDTLYHYVEVFTIFSLAVVLSLLWTALDYRRKEYRQLLYWLSVGIRYMLGVIMLVYGWAKVFKSQFPDPSLMSLLQPFGEMSPMGLLWQFMGYSLAYNIFTGLGEVIGGLLLFFRRTITLGAMILIAVLSNVVILNFTFDVPVKLFSSHLLLMALILFLLDSRRLINLFILNRPVQPMVYPLPFRSKKMLQTGRVVKAIVITGLVGVTSFEAISLYSEYGSGQPKPPLYGIYEVQQFVRNQDTIPADAIHGARWQRMIVDSHDRFHIQDMRNNFNYYHFKPDTGARKLSIFSSAQDKLPYYDFTYTMDTSSVMRLKGVNMQDSVFVELKRKDHQDYLLTNRGFHWVNEYPYNR